MARPARSARRALAILDFLAAHPTESFTLSELANHLSINVSSMHSVLSEMLETGYLVRHPAHKTYRLGPSTMAVGHAALESHPVLSVAREEMRRLTDRTGLESLAAAPFSGELVVVARAGRPLSRPLIQIGERLALVPPVGIMFVAWSPPDEIDAWLERADPRMESAVRDRYLAILSSARSLGYSVGIARDGRFVPVAPAPDDPSSLDIDPGGDYAVGYIATSVFDAQGGVSLVVTLDGFSDTLGYAEIASLAQQLRQCALTITMATHGRVPESLEPIVSHTDPAPTSIDFTGSGQGS